MKGGIVLWRKARESALIDMAKSCWSMVSVVSLRVRQRYPSQKFTRTAIVMRPKNHVPVVIHFEFKKQNIHFAS